MKSALFALALTAAIPLAGAAPAPGKFERSGRLDSSALIELSGLAAARRAPGSWWGLNDSGSPPVLFRLEVGGHVAQEVTLSNAMNLDWEDLAAYEDAGQPWLAVADTGDNFSWRSEVSLWLLPEPAPGAPQAEARQLRFTFEDGSRDCESLAADPAHDRFLLIDKGRQPAGLYAVPMHPATQPAVARRIADLPFLWQGPIPPAAPAGANRYRGSATSMDLSADGLKLAVLTYRHLALFTRAPDEDWPQAVKREPKLYALPKEPLFEAVGFSADGRELLVGTEGLKAPLYRFRVPGK